MTVPVILSLMTSPTAEFLKGTLEACRYKGPNAFVAAGFQLAIVAVREGSIPARIYVEGEAGGRLCP